MTSPRVLIVCDETGKWFVRRVRMTEHNLDLDQMIYHCDAPLSGPCADLASAVTCVERLPRGKRPKNVARETFTRKPRARR
jgi:hypothetical protein